MKYWIFFICLAGSFVFFGNSIPGDFVFDDGAVVEKRPDLKDFGHFPQLFVEPYHQNLPKSGLYRPFTMATYAFNYAILGKSPGGFHVVNIILHGLNTFLAYVLMLRLTNSKSIAGIAGFLFLAHPIHTEAISSIVGRAELLAFLFGLLSILLFKLNRTRWSAVAFFLALLSKETAVMVLPMMVVLSWWFVGERIRVLAKRMAIFIVPSVIYVGLRFVALGRYVFSGGTTTIVENQLIEVSLWVRIWTALQILWEYAVRLVWPLHLSADYSYQTFENISNPLLSLPAVLGAGVFLVLFLLLILRRFRGTVPSMGALFFLGPYLLVSNLIIPIGTIMGERLMYWPSLGFALLVGWSLDAIMKKWQRIKVFIWSILILYVSWYGVRTIMRNQDWLTQERLFTSAVRESPRAFLTRTALGAIHIRAGRWEDAKTELARASEIYSENSHLLNLLGIVAHHEKELVRAEEYWEKSIALNADAINSYINLGSLYLEQGRYNEAGEQFKRVIDFYPLAEYVIRYAYIQITLNQPDLALETITRYYGDRLHDKELAAVVGTAYFLKAEYARALEHLRIARQLGKTNPEIETMIATSEKRIKQP